MRLGGPLQGRDEVVIKEELTAREVADGLDGPGMAGWHGPGGPGGELRNDPRRPIQRYLCPARSKNSEAIF